MKLPKLALLGLLILAALLVGRKTLSVNHQHETKQQGGNICVPPKQVAQITGGAVNTPVPLSKTTTEPKQNGTKGESEDSSPNWSNWALVLVGALYTRAAFRQLGAISKQGETAESSVKALERSFYAANRPRIRIRLVYMDLGKISMADANSTTSTEAYFQVVNYGSSAANIVEAKACIWTADALPMRPPYDIAEDLRPQVAQNRFAAGEEIDLSITGPDHHMVLVVQGRRSFHILGFLSYRGPLSDVIYRTAFCRRYVANDQKFETVQNADYEYED
jgi:hypothetical protein